MVVVLLLFALIHKEDVESKQRTQQKELQRLEQELKNLKQDVKKLKIVKASSAKTKKAATQTQIPTVRQAVNYPIGCEQYKPLVAQYSWPVETVMAIMYAESGCRSDALSATGDRGLMQINWVHSAKVGGDLTKLYDPATNLAVAYQIYQASGFSPWSVCRSSVRCW